MKQTIRIAQSVALAVLVCNSIHLNAQGIISTVAGTGVAGSFGDGGAALSAQLSSPSGVSVSAGGDMYIADRGNSRIRMVSAASGSIETVAGTSWGYSGMGGPASSAQIRMPNSIFVDASGTYYFTDWYNDAAFRVDGSTGVIFNECGHDEQGDDGDGGLAPLATMEVPNGIWKSPAGDIYIVDAGTNHIRLVNGSTDIVTAFAGGTYGYSGDGGPVAAANFSGISGVCTDGYGNVYISDGGNNVIRKVDATGTVRTIAGTGVAGYSGDGYSGQHAKLNSPGHLFMNHLGYMFICDVGNNVIRVLNTNNDMIYTLAGTGLAGFSGDGGAANLAQLNSPTGVWQDISGAIYIADNGNNRIRKIVGSGYKNSPSDIANINTVDFKVYPNPSNGNIVLNTENFGSNTTLEVLNVLGEVVMTQNITEAQTSLSLHQPAGIYTLVMKTGNGKTVQKISIQ